MLFVLIQTKIVIKDVCDWQDGTLTTVYNDHSATSEPDKMSPRAGLLIRRKL